MIAVGIIGTVVLLLMRRNHKKRLERQSGLWKKERQNGILDSDAYYTDELVHVTAPGDSTLRVNIYIDNKFFRTVSKFNFTNKIFCRNLWNIL